MDVSPTPTAGEERVVWHELECGGYRADLVLWHELAEIHTGPVLDVGAGTGRVTLSLALARRAVTALDNDALLLDALRARAGELPVATICADARDFSLAERFALILVPMQTIQLLGGEAGRRRFLACARTHLRAGGLLAVAIAEQLDFFEPGQGSPLAADVCERGGALFASRPVAIREQGDQAVLERVRELVTEDGRRQRTQDVVKLDRVDASTLAREGAQAGLEPLASHELAATDEHVGSTVVMLGG